MPMLLAGGLSQQISRLVATELAIIQRGIHRSRPHPAACSHCCRRITSPQLAPETTPDSNPTRTTEDPISRKGQPRKVVKGAKKWKVQKVWPSCKKKSLPKLWYCACCQAIWCLGCKKDNCGLQLPAPTWNTTPYNYSNLYGSWQVVWLVCASHQLNQHIEEHPSSLWILGLLPSIHLPLGTGHTQVEDTQQ